MRVQHKITFNLQHTERIKTPLESPTTGVNFYHVRIFLIVCIDGHDIWVKFRISRGNYVYNVCICFLNQLHRCQKKSISSGIWKISWYILHTSYAFCIFYQTGKGVYRLALIIWQKRCRCHLVVAHVKCLLAT